MTFRDFKELLRRTAYKVLHDKAFYIVKNLNHNGYQRGFDILLFLIIQIVLLKMKTYTTNN